MCSCETADYEDGCGHTVGLDGIAQESTIVFEVKNVVHTAA